VDTLDIPLDVLQWAADQSGLSVGALVDKCFTPRTPEKRQALMAGKLTIKQVETLAKETHLPFGYFFLDKPPKTERATIPDLRQLPDATPLSVDFFDTLDDVLHKQQWYLDYLKGHGYGKLDFVGKFNSTVPVKDVADDIRKTLGLSIEEQQQCKSFPEFFSLLSEKAEAAGILVFKNGIVKNNTHRSLSVDEFRGFAIADSYAPLVFINGKDREAAWIFTLAHELVHIWLGESGIYNISGHQKVIEQGIEKYCNQVAAELLTPEALFLKAWDEASDPKIATLSKQFSVSTWVIARRAYDFKKITWNEYTDVLQPPPNQKTSSGGDFYRTSLIRNSKRLTKAILSSAMSGNMMLREAASLLNMNPDAVMEQGRRQLS
jgi:Zn-dependent peptidase ImmA (M78 family)